MKSSRCLKVSCLKIRYLTIISILCNTVIMLGITTASATANVEMKKLKVCADPNYMPFSHENKSGYENQIAELIGKELNTPVEYTWFPQRLGFIRNTLKKESENDGNYLCDLVMGVPNNYGMAMTTKPYLHSTYTIVTLKNGKLKDLTKGNDLVKLSADQLKNLSIAITERSPGAIWLARYALYEQMAPYISQSGDPDIFPGEPMLRDLLAGKVDAAIVWGPTAGYFARKDENVRVINLKSEPGIRFDFSISAAVRHGEKEWRNKVDGLLKKNSAKINEILTKAGVPLLAIKSESERVEEENKSNKKKEIEIIPPTAPVAPKPPKGPFAASVSRVTSTSPSRSTPVEFDPASSYQSHVKCTDGKNCKIDKFLLKGFRAFSQCQVCHGLDGNGSTIAPSLLEKLKKDITYDIFVDRVANGFKGQMGVMPPWKNNPNIMKKITNLYGYLKARSDGVIPAGRLKKFK